MGLMDFFKKGIEKRAEGKPAAHVNTPFRPAQLPTRTYTIKTGDSLSKIARQFYGDANDWNIIYKANKDKIKDPELIHPGQVIFIP